MTCHRTSPSAKSDLCTEKVVKSMLKSILLVDFLDQVIQLRCLEEGEIEKLLLSMDKKRINGMNKEGTSNRQYHTRRSWSEFQGKLTDRQFCRYFRMSREYLQLLAKLMEANLGEGAFKSIPS